MGTRSLTLVYDNNEKPIMCMYRQFDGYMAWHGWELARFLTSFDAIVNGYSPGDTRKIANGMGCLAAQMVGHFKQGEVGGFYLYPTDTRNVGEEYVYEVFPDKVRVTNWEEVVIFTGTWQEFLAECKKTD